jgi:RHS repeat-associated protein
MVMAERHALADGAHRYGFNGKENDDDVKGEGNQQDYGFRIYDSRVARFLSVDPLAPEYPWYTPYQFAGNTPIQAIDLDGLEPAFPGDYNGQGAHAPAVSSDLTNGTTTTSETLSWVWNSGMWGQADFAVTSDQLNSLFPDGNKHLLSAVESDVNLYGESFGLNTKRSVAHFLSQTGHESAGMALLTENMNYSAKGLTNTWPRRFTMMEENVSATLNFAPDFAKKPQLIGNEVYGGRMGNVEPGDGYKYRGRGIAMLTGRSVYTGYQSFLSRSQSLNGSGGLDVVANPELLSKNLKLAVQSAMWYFDSKVNLNLETATVTEVSKVVNGGTNGLIDRQKRFQDAMGALNGH